MNEEKGKPVNYLVAMKMPSLLKTDEWLLGGLAQSLDDATSTICVVRLPRMMTDAQDKRGRH